MELETPERSSSTVMTVNAAGLMIMMGSLEKHRMVCIVWKNLNDRIYSIQREVPHIILSPEFTTDSRSGSPSGIII
jgi:hypothetical protein